MPRLPPPSVSIDPLVIVRSDPALAMIPPDEDPAVAIVPLVIEAAFSRGLRRPVARMPTESLPPVVMLSLVTTKDPPPPSGDRLKPASIAVLWSPTVDTLPL